MPLLLHCQLFELLAIKRAIKTYMSICVCVSQHIITTAFMPNLMAALISLHFN